MTSTIEAPRPVTDHENREVHGAARAHAAVFQQDQERVAALRARQTAYVASLPRDAAERLAAARALLNRDDEGYPEGFGEALRLSHALAAMVRDDEGDGPAAQAAARWLANRLVWRLEDARADIDRIGDLLRDPKTWG